MRSRLGGLTVRTSAAMLSGFLALASVTPAMAQGKPPAKAAAAAPAKAAAAPAKPAAPTPAKPAAPAPAKAAAAPAGKGDKVAAAAPAKPKKNLTDAQKKDAAKKAYKEAEAKFEAGDYAGAVTLYQEADELVPGPQPKYKIGVSLDKLNKPIDAVAGYQRFIDANPDPDKFKDKLIEAKARQEALRKTPAKVKVAIIGPETPPADLKLDVDGAPQNGNELSVPPGKHKIGAKAAGFDPASQDVEVSFAEQKEITVTLNKAAPVAVAAVPPPPAATTTTTAAPTKPAEPVEPHSNVPAYVTLGLAGAGAIVGTIFGIQALSAKSDYDATPTQEKFDSAERNALLADMSYGVALTFGVTGVVLLLSGDQTTEPAKAGGAKAAPAKTGMSKPLVLPYAGPNGGGATATLRF